MEFKLKYQDINSSEIHTLCTCESELIANWILTALHKDMSIHYDKPDRKFYIEKIEN